MTTTTKKQAAERDEARGRLLARLRPGDTVYTTLLHRTRSGMGRTIQALVPATDQDGQPTISDISYLVARVLGWPFDRDRGGVKVAGAGMDMGFHLVYSLSAALYPDGFTCTGDGCDGNDHVNPPRPPRDGKMHHRSGGYALRHRWI